MFVPGGGHHQRVQRPRRIRIFISISAEHHDGRVQPRRPTPEARSGGQRRPLPALQRNFRLVRRGLQLCDSLQEEVPRCSARVVRTRARVDPVLQHLRSVRDQGRNCGGESALCHPDADPESGKQPGELFKCSFKN